MAHPVLFRCPCGNNLRSRVAARVAAEGRSHPTGRLFWGGVKEFLDGSLGSCTALMYDPYLKGSCGTKPGVEQAATGEVEGGGGYGLRMVEFDELIGLVEAADEAGLQVRPYFTTFSP